MGAITTFKKAVRQAIQPNREISKAEFEAKRASNGYEDSELIRFRVERAKLHREDATFLSTGSARFLALLVAASMAAPARVLDFGGGFGHYGMQLRAALPSLADYKVAELPAFIDVATAAGFSGFISEPREAKANVVFTSGTLQYMPDPLATLAGLVELDPEYLVLARNSFSDRSARYFEQRSMLFEHGDGPVPPGFANRQILLHPQAMPADEVFRLISLRYEVIVRTPNSDGLVYDSDGLFGEDLICRRRS